MNAITLDPAAYTCPDHGTDLTDQVKQALEEEDDTPRAYRRPLLGRRTPRARPFEVIITCPGGGQAHSLTCTGTYRQ
jgi:hypothetical protein